MDTVCGGKGLWGSTLFYMEEVTSRGWSGIL